MSEIEKLYENAGIRYFDINACKIDETGKNGKHNIYKYPPFTAEKQLELIKWLILNDFVDELDMFYRPFDLMWVFQIYNVTEFANEKRACCMGADMTFEKGLASLINNLWQDLTEQEKAEIKRILE